MDWLCTFQFKSWTHCPISFIDRLICCSFKNAMRQSHYLHRYRRTKICTMLNKPTTWLCLSSCFLLAWFGVWSGFILILDLIRLSFLTQDRISPTMFTIRSAASIYIALCTCYHLTRQPCGWPFCQIFTICPVLHPSSTTLRKAVPPPELWIWLILLDVLLRRYRWIGLKCCWSIDSFCLFFCNLSVPADISICLKLLC